MDNVIIEFDDKKTKTNFLKALEFVNHRLKNIFNSVYVNKDGYCYSSDVINKNIGRIFIKTDIINTLFNIKERDVLCLYPKEIYNCIKSGKTKILSIINRYDDIIVLTTENEFKIGTYLKEQKLNIDKYLEIDKNSTINKNSDSLLNKLLSKEYVDFILEDYKMFITHKLFPSINKIDIINIGITDINDNTFYAIFRFISKDNKNNELTTFYIYRFAKL